MEQFFSHVWVDSREAVRFMDVRRMQATLAGIGLCLGLAIGMVLPDPNLAAPVLGMIGATAGIVAIGPRTRAEAFPMFPGRLASVSAYRDLRSRKRRLD